MRYSHRRESIVRIDWETLLATYGQPVEGSCLTLSEMQEALREQRLFSLTDPRSRPVTDEDVLSDLYNQYEGRHSKAASLLVFPSGLPLDLCVSIERNHPDQGHAGVLHQNTPAKEREVLANEQLLQAAAAGLPAEAAAALAAGSYINVLRPVKTYRVWWGNVHSEGALDLAVLSGNRETVAILLGRGISLANPRGTYAWMCAACNGRHDLADDLERAGVVVKVENWQQRRVAELRAQAAEKNGERPIS
jgi:hypothetical protein